MNYLRKIKTVSAEIRDVIRWYREEVLPDPSAVAARSSGPSRADHPINLLSEGQRELGA